MSSVAEIFASGAIPAIEGGLARKVSYSRLLQLAASRLPAEATVSQEALRQAVARVQLSSQRGAAIELGSQVPASTIPVDPSIPADVGYRYRVKVTVAVPSPLPGIEGTQFSTVIPVDSGEQLDRTDIIARATEVLSQRMATHPEATGAGFYLAANAANAPAPEYSVLTVYRGPLTGP